MSDPNPKSIVRRSLLTAVLQQTTALDRIEVKQVDFAPNQRSGVHLHPCPVVGLIVRGSIVFQIAGEPQRVLLAGSAFHEPAGVTIERFDAGDEPTTFVAFYLQAGEHEELIQMLE